MASRVAAYFTLERRIMLLNLSSVGAGGFLLLAGIVGCTAPFLGGGLVYFIGALYSIVFGIIVIVVDIKVSERVAKVAVAYALIDKYLKFLTLQRGKGLFYLGVGLLVFFIEPTTGPSVGGHWGINNLAALFLAVVGVLHTFRLCHEQSAPSGAAVAHTMPPADGLEASFSKPVPSGGAKKQWTQMVDDDGL
jgi:hypothetical protein